MLVMGLDTALQRCSVAILRDGVVVADHKADMERGHAERIALMAAAALAEAGVKIHDLERIGVVIGPGGFAGVRIALAFARGLAIGTGVSVVGVTSLAALAANQPSEDPDGLIAAIIDARRGQVYAGLYNMAGQCIVDPFVTEPEQALKILNDAAHDHPVAMIGSGAALLTGVLKGWRLSPADPQISASAVARLAAEAASAPGSPAPLYLRAPDAKPAKPGAFSGTPPR